MKSLCRGALAALLLVCGLAACGGGSSGSAGSTGTPSGSSGGGSSGSSGASSGASSSGSSGASSGASSGGSSGASSGGNTGVPMGQSAAARLLMMGTFGANLAQINAAAAQSYDTWFASQAALTPTHELPLVPAWNSDRQMPWWTVAVKAQDQLRQRVAFALSELLVVSETNAQLSSQGQALANYYDLLTDNALGNFRTLLDVVSHSPVMGQYLTFFKNEPPNATLGTHADENYAREIMQLFTVGLWKLNADGSRQLDASGHPIPTYAQADVSNLARVFTGWGSAPQNGQTGNNAWLYANDLIDPMVCYPAYHDTGAKTIIGGVVIAAGGTCQSDMQAALDTLFQHPNVGPFVGRQLIQRLVTSNPSPAYVARVAAVFANDGTGVRGNLAAVVRAILTDAEAVTASTAPTAGKLREPILRLTNLWRAFSALDAAGMVQDTLELNTQTDFAQASLLSPTVFNFFRPDYQRAGPLAIAGLVVPEFQITNEFTLVQGANDVERLAYNFIDSAGNQCAGPDGYAATAGSGTVFLHTAELEPLAPDPATLVNTLSLMLMGGQMPAAMNTSLVNYVSTIPLTPVACYTAGNSNGGSGPALRVIEAAELIINSPQYAIQR